MFVPRAYRHVINALPRRGNSAAGIRAFPRQARVFSGSTSSVTDPFENTTKGPRELRAKELDTLGAEEGIWDRIKTSEKTQPGERPPLQRSIRPQITGKGHGKLRIMDGNTAAAYIAYAMSEQSFLFPITPASSASEYLEQLAGREVKNVFGNKLKVTTLQSEGGVAGSMHGASTLGSIVTTFTSSQGLLLMIPNLYKIAGGHLPLVLHVPSRVVSSLGLSIFADQGDIMACRMTGFAMLSSSDVQECHDMALASHICTYRTFIPFMHFYDGMNTSHQSAKVSILDYEDLKQFIPWDGIEIHRQRALSPNHPMLKSPVLSQDTWFQMQESTNSFWDSVPNHLQNVFDEIAPVVGRSYSLFEYHGHPEAKEVIVTMSGGVPICREMAEHMNRVDGDKVGVLQVRLYRPWHSKGFLDALPASVEKLTVLERVKDHGAREPLFLDVGSSILTSPAHRHIHVLGGRFGLGSKNFSPTMAKAVFDNMKKPEPNQNFTVGIEDDVNNTHLEVGPTIESFPKGQVNCLFYGLSGDGTVGANKSACKIVGEGTDLAGVSATFQYGAQKAGGLTISQIRFGPEPILTNYDVAEADYLGVHNPAFINRYDLAERVRKDGIFMVNSTWNTVEDWEKHVPAKMLRELAEKNANVYNIDAFAVAKKAGMGQFINNVMQTCFFSLSGVLPEEQALRLFKLEIEEKFAKKGAEVVQKNKDAVDLTISSIKKIEYDRNRWMNLVPNVAIQEVRAGEEKLPFQESFMDKINSFKGDDIPVSAFVEHGTMGTDFGGIFPLGNTQYEKRGIATHVPIVNMETCTQCNYCSLVCPHAAIRPFLLSQAEVDTARSLGADFAAPKAAGGSEVAGLSYTIQVAPLDCTGCEVCAVTCPVDALEMTPLERVADQQEVNWVYLRNDVKSRGKLVERETVKGSQFQTPLLEFSGACAGCGETPYVKLMTQLFGERMIIANSSGCTTVWGGTFASVPYTVNEDGRGSPWATSLFEDTAEYGFGMAYTTNNKRDDLEAAMRQVVKDCEKGTVELNDELRRQMEEWVEYREDPDVCARLNDTMPPLLEGILDQGDVFRQIYSLRDLIPKVAVWIVGGDGWAYDIGFGGLDHIVQQPTDINIVILDTEVYSNTGGQFSKSTPMGAVAGFASIGRRTGKKDLGSILMDYENVYVASCSLGASYKQTLRAFVDAESYKGPSVVMCYAPCIEHNVKGGLSQMIEQTRLAGESGYFAMYRYDPRLAAKGENPFQLDMKKRRENVEDFLQTQGRYMSLGLNDPSIRESLGKSLNNMVDAQHEKFKFRAAGGMETLSQLSAATGTDVGENKIHVLYGSETGNAEELALRLGQLCKGRGYQTHVAALEEVDLEELNEAPSLCLFVVSTAGEGDTPANAVSFQETLNSWPADVKLENIRFASFGLGDTSYVHYNKAMEDIDLKLEQLGATKQSTMGYGNDKDADKYETAFEEWEPAMFSAINAPPPLDEDALPEVQLQLEVAESTQVSSRKAEPILPPKATRLPLTKNDLLTPEDYKEREIRHFEIDLAGTEFAYALGDAIAIYPFNSENNVAKALKLYDLSPSSILKIKVDGKIDQRRTVAFRGKLTAEQVFTEFLDLFGRPTRHFWKTLKKFASDPNEKEKLTYLLSDEGKQEMQKLDAECVTTYDLLVMFPSARPPLEHLLSLAPVIKPRLYSIASSPRYMEDKVELCIVTNTWNNDSGKELLGLATSYLREQPVGTSLLCAPAAGTFKFPPTSEYPMLMAGLGTGLAPFRAFAQHRAWEISQEKSLVSGPMVIYYGCRHEKKDYIYQKELEAFDFLTMRPAFSRDQAKKVYVQNKVEEDGKQINDWIGKKAEKPGYFYLCGQAGQVEDDVCEAVRKSFIDHGKMTKEEAEEYWAEMVKTGRYCPETY